MTTAGGRAAVLIAVLSAAASAALPVAGAAARPWPAPASRVTAGPVGPSSVYNTLTSVSADSASDAWAVGSYVSNTTAVRDTLILHWDGTAWSRVASPDPGTRFNVLNGVSAGGAKNAWAVGNNPDLTTGPGQTLVMQWNGTFWPRVPSPDAGAGTNVLTGVSAVSGTDVWAVGDSQPNVSSGPLRTLILHWDGTAWSPVSSPNASPASNVLTGVSADSATDAWAVGYYLSKGVRYALIQRWNGTAWSVR